MREWLKRLWQAALSGSEQMTETSESPHVDEVNIYIPQLRNPVIIAAAPTNVFYWNQVNGVAVEQRSLEGLLVAAASIVLALLVWPRFSDLATSAAANARRIQQGAALHLDVETDQVEVLGAYFERHQVAARVIDLGMFGYKLVGGGIHRLGGRRSAFFVYRGPGGRLLICEMYEGTEKELPEGAEVRRIGRFTFFVYAHLGQTVVFWKERQSMCVLVSDAPKDEVIRLAAAKAM